MLLPLPQKFANPLEMKLRTGGTINSEKDTEILKIIRGKEIGGEREGEREGGVALLKGNMKNRTEDKCNERI